jgi:REP element-mobilizing transposase RayT
MSGSLDRHVVTVREGAYLPHWTRDGATYAVCFRLADSLPQAVVEAWRLERAALLQGAGEHPTAAQRERIHELFADRIEQHLDAGPGACWLRHPEIAGLVAGTLRHFDGQHYTLLAWCIMPNHVHVVVQPLGRHTLPSILKSWKGFSGKEANQRLHRQGAFWQPEYYDHLIRDAHDLVHAVRYVLANPANARLIHWPWVWVSEQVEANLMPSS